MMRFVPAALVTLMLGCASGPHAQKAPDTVDGDATSESPAAESDEAAPEEKLGSLPKEEILAVVRENMRDIQACYDSELEVTPGLAGRVVVHFKIAPDGKIAEANIGESTLDNRAVERCIVADVQGWEFNEPENDGVVIVNYPFNFKAN